MYRFLKQFTARILLVVRDLAGVLGFQEVGILAYHSISDAEAPTAITLASFTRHIVLLARAGYTFVSLEQINTWQDGSGTLPRKCVAITFDDGYADFEFAALPVLQAHSIPVTLFIVGSREGSAANLGNGIPLLSPDALTRIQHDPLVTLGYHSKTHSDLRGCSETALAEELTPTIPTKLFAYPGGRYTLDTAHSVRLAGYTSAYTIKPILVGRNTDRFQMPRSVVTKDMQDWQVRFFVSKAADWYRGLRRHTSV